MKDALRISVVMLLFLTLLTGVIYPLAVTAVAQVAFPSRANGSLVVRGGKPVGSSLVGQSFTRRNYFWGRPSATSPNPYNAASSSGSNLGPLNPTLKANAQARIEELRKGDPSIKAIPVDLVTASGSGLDPHVSPAAAELQVPRVARERGESDDEIRQLVIQCTEGRQLGLLGEPRVNVLLLNLALDRPTTKTARSASWEIPLAAHHAQTAAAPDRLRAHTSLGEVFVPGEVAGPPAGLKASR